MKPVPYFDKLVDPWQFRKGHGLTGWLIIVMAAVYAFAERKLHLLILRAELRDRGMTGSRLRAIMRMTAADRALFPDPPKRDRVALREKIGLDDLSPRSAKYAEGRDLPPMRPIPLDEGMAFTFGRFMRKTNRSAKYQGAREHYTLYEPEEDNHA